MEQFSDAEHDRGGVVGLPTDRGGYDNMKVGLLFQLAKKQTPQTCHFSKAVEAVATTIGSQISNAKCPHTKHL